MRVERKEMSLGEEHGFIQLKKIAKPETVKVFLEGEEIVPEFINTFGIPIFSPVTTLRYLYQGERNRRDGKPQLLFEVRYEEADMFSLYDSKEKFDSIEGIEESLESLSSFQELLGKRLIFTEETKNIPLGEFVVYGRYYLDQYGQILEIQNESFVEEDPWVPDVCTRNHFDLLTNSYNVTDKVAFPKTEGERCAYCGKKMTIGDLKKGFEKIRLLQDKEEIVHKKCFEDFVKDIDLDEITSFVDEVYPEKPKMELIPNGANPSSFILWYLFHTSDGDIIIGKEEIGGDTVIEWQENYKPFDMAIFNGEACDMWYDDEDVSSLEMEENFFRSGNVRRGVTAESIEKANTYLTIVKMIAKGELSKSDTYSLVSRKKTMDELL